MVLTSDWGMELRIEIGEHLMPLPYEKCIQLWHFVMFYLDQSLNEWDLHFVDWEDFEHEDFILFQNCSVSPSDSFPPDKVMEFSLLSVLAIELAQEDSLIVTEPLLCPVKLPQPLWSITDPMVNWESIPTYCE